ncbi:MAG: dihydrolipoyl dehydrogenase family protein [Desulfatibacillaceae bacterium]
MEMTVFGAHDYDYDVGILGGGAAGLTVASGAAQLGAKTLLVEKEGRLGGDCLHFGCVPSKTLIRSARVYHLMKNAEKYGLPRVDAPPVDFGDIAARIAKVVAQIQKHDSEERFCGLGARVRYGEPVFTDEHTVELRGERITADKWVIATGSSPAAPPIPGLDTVDYFTNREIFHLDHLPDSMIVLGGGPIGIEMAQAFSRLGTRVTVVDRGGQILGKEDPDMAAVVQRAMSMDGVEFCLNTQVQSVREHAGAREVTVKTPEGGEQVLRAEALLVALGRVANVMDLGLDSLGMEAGPRGIAVDDRMRTKHKHIFACGDAAGGYQFTHVAGYEGGVVLANAVFRIPRKADYTNVCWCTYTDPELASIGMNERAATEAGIGYQVIEEPFSANDRALAEEEQEGKAKLLLDEKENPIGVQICGPHAGELISEWVAAFAGKARLSALAGAIHPYPTLGEMGKKLAGDVLQPKVFSSKMKKGLHFVFATKGRACHPEQNG